MWYTEYLMQNENLMMKFVIKIKIKHMIQILNKKVLK